MFRNNIIDIIGIKPAEMNLFPNNIIEEIVQNIRIILTTAKGTVPLDRNFGLNITFLDEPHPVAMMKLRIEILESIQEWEPRVAVQKISFISDKEKALDGKLFPKVEVRIFDEYLS